MQTLKIEGKLQNSASCGTLMEVYGEAWPLISKWREIRKAGHIGVGKGLA